MKTKLTLNIDDGIIKKAKQVSARKKVSLSSIIEEYLVRYTAGTVSKRNSSKKNSITTRIRKLTKPVAVSDAQLKNIRAKHLQTKYGK